MCEASGHQALTPDVAKAAPCRCARLKSACADHDSVSSCARQRAADAAQADADRRPFDCVPGLLALPVENFSTQTGQHTNGVFGFTSMLINVLRDEEPTPPRASPSTSHVTRSAPRSTASTRRIRTTTPDEFRGQLDLVKEALKALNISYVEKEGYEADDVIGTLATRLKRLASKC